MWRPPRPGPPDRAAVHSKAGQRPRRSREATGCGPPAEAAPPRPGRRRGRGSCRSRWSRARASAAGRPATTRPDGCGRPSRPVHPAAPGTARGRSRGPRSPPTRCRRARRTRSRRGSGAEFWKRPDESKPLAAPDAGEPIQHGVRRVRRPGAPTPRRSSDGPAGRTQDGRSGARGPCGPAPAPAAGCRGSAPLRKGSSAVVALQEIGEAGVDEVVPGQRPARPGPADAGAAAPGRRECGSHGSRRTRGGPRAAASRG